ncbi:MAG: ZIP family metal transporter [Lysobacterales bacterium]|jgi:zinc and cadmium transporter
MLIAWIAGFSVLGSVGAIIGAAVLLAFPEMVRRTMVPYLVSYAGGTLLGAAFLGMIPAALGAAPMRSVLVVVLAGLVAFFVLEKLVIWRHCHDAACEVHGQAAPLILIGDAFHNFVDGVVIAAAFLVSVPLGITAAIAVILHEVPQEVGDFAILLDSGYTRVRALLLNTLSSLTTVAGALLAWLWLERTSAVIPYVLAVSAASFVYIALADLVPGLHKRSSFMDSVLQTVLLVLGIATIALVKTTGGGQGPN